MSRSKTRLFKIFLPLLVLCLIFSSFSFYGNVLVVNAGSSTTIIKLWIGKPYMEVNGVRQPIDSQGTTPIIMESRTLVPIRAIIEALGGSIQWDASSKKVSIFLNNNTLELWINNPIASLNGFSTQIDPMNSKVVPLIINGRTMLPLRFVAESLGIEVQYDAVSKMITLTYVLVTIPESPTLASPNNGSIVTTDVITFTWLPIEGVDYYALNVSSNSSTVHSNDRITTSTYSIAKSNIGEGTFSWKVRAHNSAGWGPWSMPYVFIIQPAVTLPSAPNPVSPQTNAFLNSTNITFTWTAVTGADSYRFQLLFNGIVVHAQEGIATNSFTLPIDLSNGIYSWQVSAHNSAGWGPWSSISTFTLKKQLSVSDIAKFVDRVVYIEVNGYDKNGKAFQSVGSGFIISSDGRIATNYHVIDGAVSGTVTLNDGRKYNIAYVLGYAAPKEITDKDLAVLKINENNLPICDLGDSESIQVGESVVAIGSPLGLPNVVTTGIVSKVWGEGIIQITAPLSPGNSGGPLFNMYGEVIGINTFKITQGENLNFALPVNWLKSLDTSLMLTLEQVRQKEYGNISIRPDVPKLISPYDGAVLTTTTPTLIWQPVSGATKYIVLVYKNSISSENVVIGEITTSTSYQIPPGKLYTGYKYIWTVVAYDSNGNYSDVSKLMIWSFSIQQVQLSKPTLLSPKEKNFFLPSINNSITFEWTSVQGATQYTLWIGYGTTGLESTNIYKKTTTLTTLSVPITIFTPGTVYTWAIGVSDSYGNLVWSDDMHFSVVLEGVISLISPYKGERTSIPMLSWSRYSIADSYFLAVFTDTFDIVYSKITFITLDVVPFGKLQLNKYYYWQVFAINEDGYIIACSPMWYFYYGY
ncbi:MAG: trypsin-like peptidase domain-containing protein [Nitrososphaerota archaeon]